MHLISIFWSTGTVNRRATRHSRSKYKIFLHHLSTTHVTTTVDDSEERTIAAGLPTGLTEIVIARLVLLAERLPCCC